MEEDLDEFGEYIGEEYSESNNSASNSENEYEDIDSDDNSEPLIRSYQYDTHDISDPLVERKPSLEYKTVTPELWEFQFGIMSEAKNLLRNIGLVGHMNHGKTAFYSWIMDESTNTPTFCHLEDNLIEKERGTTIFPSFTSVLTETSHEKSFVFNIVDTPGHPDMVVETNVCIDMCDGLVNIVDVVEGVSQEYRSLPQVVILNKLDRLILDQRLPPNQAFRRLKYLTESLNTDLSDVVFASAKYRLCFTLDTISQLYKASNSQGIINSELDLTTEPNFVKFVLEPIYKLITCGLVGESTKHNLASWEVELDDSDWQLGYDERIALILQRFYQSGIQPLIDNIVKKLPPVNRRFNDDDDQKTELEKSTIRIYEQGVMFTISRATEDISDNCTYWIPYGDRRVPVSCVPKGSWYISRQSEQQLQQLHVKSKQPQSVMKVDVEPTKLTTEHHRELGNLLEIVSNVFTGSYITTRETGIYSIFGTGEFYIDTFLGFLRQLGGRFHVGTPYVEFNETVSSETSIGLPAKIKGDPANYFTVVALPEIDIETLEKNLWHRTFSGCNLVGPFPKSEYPPAVVENIIEGFEWFVQRGPLVEGIVRNVTIKILEIHVKDIYSQWSSTMHRASSAAMLLASPSLMEPTSRVTVIGTLAAGRACYSEIVKRGGNIISDEPIFGTSLYKTEGIVATIDSFGLESDIMCQLESLNRAQVTTRLEGWKLVPGDALDVNIKASRLKPASDESRARDFLLKTRKAQGLSAEPLLDRFIDEEVRKLIN